MEKNMEKNNQNSSKNKVIKYTITNLHGTSRKAIICPFCSEKLMREDVEQYSACPYCGKKLLFTTEMEDFILVPFIDPWDLNAPRLIPELSISEDSYNSSDKLS